MARLLFLRIVEVNPDNGDLNGWSLACNVIRKGGEPAPLIILLLQAYASSKSRRTLLLMATKRVHTPVGEQQLYDYRVFSDLRT